MNRELLMLVDALAMEKNVSKSIVFDALEMALASATKKRMKQDMDVRVSIDPDTGDYQSFRRWLVVEDEFYESSELQKTLDDAKKINQNIELNAYIEESLEPIEFGRIGAQAAKQVILQKIREAERNQILNDFLDRDELIVTGSIKRLERGNAIIDSGRIEASLPKDQMIPKENLRVGDRIRAFLVGVDREARGAQLLLSRTTPEFLMKLFELEVPEIEEGLLEIKAAARDPGARAKIAVKSNDPRIDPIGTCVGMRGSRVQAVTSELAGERVDIILWNDEPVQFVISALAPAEVLKITVDEEKQTMDIVVDEDNLAQAIGRGGQNVRLASELSGWDLNIVTEEEADKKNEEEAVAVRELFMLRLDVDEDLANTLILEGFSTLEEIAYVPVNELVEIESLDENLVEELRKRARDSLLVDAIATEQEVENETGRLSDVEGITKEIIKSLQEHDILSQEQLADLASDELVEMIGLDQEVAKSLILSARAPWFKES